MSRLALRLGVFVLMAAGCAAGAQVGSVGRQAVPGVPALREIDDLHSGARWLLVKDPSHPGGPGRLVRVDRGEAAGMPGSARVPMPIIHAGDRVLVEEHNAIVDAVLEAVALGPAVEGGLFPARLKVGGRVLRVSAVAPGRAKICLGTGRRP